MSDADYIQNQPLMHIEYWSEQGLVSVRWHNRGPVGFVPITYFGYRLWGKEEWVNEMIKLDPYGPEGIQHDTN